MSTYDLAGRSDHDVTPFSEVRCTRCGSCRLKRQNGTPGACPLIGCPSPLYDVDTERGLPPCSECKGRGWHVGECHPREVCGVCNGRGRPGSFRVGEVSNA